jgi:lysophospholipase L1-like esterase
VYAPSASARRRFFFNNATLCEMLASILHQAVFAFKGQRAKKLTRHADLYEDAFHFNKAGSAIMGDHVTAIIKNASKGRGMGNVVNRSRSPT